MGGVVIQVWNHCKLSLIRISKMSYFRMFWARFHLAASNLCVSSSSSENSGEFKFHSPPDYFVMRIERYFLSLLRLSQAINTSLLMFEGISNLRTLPMTVERQKWECNRLWKSTFPFPPSLFFFDSKTKFFGRWNCCLLRFCMFLLPGRWLENLSFSGSCVSG